MVRWRLSCQVSSRALFRRPVRVPSPNRNSCEYRFNDPKWPSASEEPVDPCQGTRRAKCEDKPRATILNGVGD